MHDFLQGCMLDASCKLSIRSVDCRGEPVGDCGGCQVMSNPLILHGTQISIPKPRPQPMPRIPEETREPMSPQSEHVGAVQMGAAMGQGGQAGSAASGQLPAAPQAPVQASPPPFRSASSSSVFLPAAPQPVKLSGRAAHVRGPEDVKDRVLNADERLQRLKLRMQSTIEAYSGGPSNAANAGRYTRSQSMTAASPYAAFHRTNSSPTRPSRVSLYGGSRRAAEDASSSHSSSSCSTSTTSITGEGTRSGPPGQGCSVPDDRSLMQARSLGSNRGIPQVRTVLLLPMWVKVYI